MKILKKMVIGVDVVVFALLVFSAVVGWPFSIYFVEEWFLWLGILLLIGFNLHFISQE